MVRMGGILFFVFVVIIISYLFILRKYHKRAGKWFHEYLDGFKSKKKKKG